MLNACSNVKMLWCVTTLYKFKIRPVASVMSIFDVCMAVNANDISQLILVILHKLLYDITISKALACIYLTYRYFTTDSGNIA